METIFLFVVAVMVIGLVKTAMQNRHHERTDRRFCKGCGAVYPSPARFCGRCGRAFEGTHE